VRYGRCMRLQLIYGAWNRLYFFPTNTAITQKYRDGSKIKFMNIKKRKLKITEILLLTLCPNHIHQKTMKKKYWNHQIT